MPNFGSRSGNWKAQHGRAVKRVEQLQVEVERLGGENRKLQHQLFGRKSKSSSRDRLNRLEGEDEERPPSPPRKQGQRKDQTGPSLRVRATYRLSGSPSLELPPKLGNAVLVFCEVDRLKNLAPPASRNLGAWALDRSDVPT
jgi:hypothetical protein